MTCEHLSLMKWRTLFIYLFILFTFVPENDHWIHNLPQRWISGIISYGKQLIHTVFSMVVSEEMNTYLPGGGHFEFYARWPPGIDHNLFAMVFETIMPIPTTMPNLKNLAPSARFIWIPPPLLCSTGSQWSLSRMSSEIGSNFLPISIAEDDSMPSCIHVVRDLSWKQWRTEGSGARGEDGNWRPSPSACQNGTRRRRSPSLFGGLGRSPSRQRFWEHFGVNETHFWIALIPFSTRRVRLASAKSALPHYWGGLGWRPSRQRFWEHLGVNETHFWIALIPFSTRRVRLASAKSALPHYWGGGLGRRPSRQRFWEHLGVNGTHFWIALTPFSTRRVRLASAKVALPRYWRVWGGAPAANVFGSIWVWMEPISEYR